MRKDIILRYHHYDGDIWEAIRDEGLVALWNGSHPFEISASECITLTELRLRWPSITDNYIAENFGEGTYLPLAVREAHYSDEDTYLCTPVPIEYRAYLTIPKGHPAYEEKFLRSYQCFKGEEPTKDFVLPLCEVEAYEQHNSDVLRLVVPFKKDSLHKDDFAEIQKPVQLIGKLPLYNLNPEERKQCLAELLAYFRVPAKIAYPLITGNFPDKKESHTKGIQRLRAEFRELMEKYRIEQ